MSWSLDRRIAQHGLGRMLHYFWPAMPGQWRGTTEGNVGDKTPPLRYGEDAKSNLKPAQTSTVFSDSARRLLRRRLLRWYDQHARDLPWRRTRDPYAIWVSEIMLQQTRVAAVIEHYHEFLKRFPTVEKLASARESSVLAIWSGLGYYRRARMLHAAARKIVRDLGGKMPSTAESLRELPGIGRYTAAAIASIAFGERAAVVDGNVERVLQRLTGKRMDGEPVWKAAEELLAPKRPGDFNQAMMELGATICVPRGPLCLACPLQELCETRGELPGAEKDKPQEKREIHYGLSYRNGAGRTGEVFLVQRPRDASLMPGMWELPGSVAVNGAGSPWLTLRHSITVTDYTVRVWRQPAASAAGRWIALERLEKTALTGLARKILRRVELL